MQGRVRVIFVVALLAAFAGGVLLTTMISKPTATEGPIRDTADRSGGTPAEAAAAPASGFTVATEELSVLADGLGSFAVALVSLTAAAVLLPLILVLAVRLWRLWRFTQTRPQLVVEDPADDSGDEIIKNRLGGFGHAIREGLARELSIARREVTEQDGGPDSLLHSTKSAMAPVPQQPLQELLDALAKAAPEDAKWATQVLQLAKAAFPPRGFKVTGRLRRGDARDAAGLSFEIADLRQEEETTFFTVWEPAQIPVSDSLAARYGRMLEPALRRLAYEVSLRQQASGVPDEEPWIVPPSLSPDTRKEEQENAHYAYLASLHNFYGSLYTASAPPYEQHVAQFYVLSIGQLKEAIRLVRKLEESYLRRSNGPVNGPVVEGTRNVLGNAFLPHENLGTAMSFLGREREDPTLQEEALIHYGAALSRVDRVPDVAADGTSGRRLALRWRIETSRAIAQLLSEDADLIHKAVGDVRRIETSIDADEVRKIDLLYALACWYAVALSVASHEEDTVVQQALSELGVDLEQKARYYLVRALGRDDKRDLWNWFVLDEDLEILGDNFRKALRRNLARKEDTRNLATLPADKFVEQVSEVLRKTVQTAG